MKKFLIFIFFSFILNHIVSIASVYAQYTLNHKLQKILFDPEQMNQSFMNNTYGEMLAMASLKVPSYKTHDERIDYGDDASKKDILAKDASKVPQEIFSFSTELRQREVEVIYADTPSQDIVRDYKEYYATSNTMAKNTMDRSELRKHMVLESIARIINAPEVQNNPLKSKMLHEGFIGEVLMGALDKANIELDSHAHQKIMGSMMVVPNDPTTNGPRIESIYEDDYTKANQHLEHALSNSKRSLEEATENVLFGDLSSASQSMGETVEHLKGIQHDIHRQKDDVGALLTRSLDPTVKKDDRLSAIESLFTAAKEDESIYFKNEDMSLILSFLNNYGQEVKEKLASQEQIDCKEKDKMKEDVARVETASSNAMDVFNAMEGRYAHRQDEPIVRNLAQEIQQIQKAKNVAIQKFLKNKTVLESPNTDSTQKAQARTQLVLDNNFIEQCNTAQACATEASNTRQEVAEGLKYKEEVSNNVKGTFEISVANDKYRK